MTKVIDFSSYRVRTHLLETAINALEDCEASDVALTLLHMFDNGLLDVRFNEDAEPMFSLREDVTSAELDAAGQDWEENAPV
jgi:hypothetical protein